MKNSKIKKIIFIIFNILSIVVGLLILITSWNYYSEIAQCGSYNVIEEGCQTVAIFGMIVFALSIFINVLNFNRMASKRGEL